MVMESDMPITAQLIIARLVPALLTHFSFGLDIHGFALKCCKISGCLRVMYTLKLIWEWVVTLPDATSYACDSARRFVTCE